MLQPFFSCSSTTSLGLDAERRATTAPDQPDHDLRLEY
jgi:hypothetical protein